FDLSISVTQHLYDPNSYAATFIVYIDVIPSTIEAYIFPALALIIGIITFYSTKKTRSPQYQKAGRKKRENKTPYKDKNKDTIRIPLEAKTRKKITKHHDISSVFLSGKSKLTSSRSTNKNRKVNGSFSRTDIIYRPKGHPKEKEHAKVILGTDRICAFCGKRLSGDEIKCPHCGMLNLA
ncbi:MAG: hypothetical protein ACTSW4_03200, partial [Candidatus Ranarchaeia archaeon]